MRGLPVTFLAKRNIWTRLTAYGGRQDAYLRRETICRFPDAEGQEGPQLAVDCLLPARPQNHCVLHIVDGRRAGGGGSREAAVSLESAGDQLLVHF